MPLTGTTACSFRGRSSLGTVSLATTVQMPRVSHAPFNLAMRSSFPMPSDSFFLLSSSRSKSLRALCFSS